MRQGSRDRQALLLAARKPGAEIVEAVLHLVEKRGLPQAALDELVEHGALANAGHARRERDVVVDRHRQPDRQREHHADAAAQCVDVAHRCDVLAVDADRALDAHARNRCRTCG